MLPSDPCLHITHVSGHNIKYIGYGYKRQTSVILFLEGIKLECMRNFNNTFICDSNILDCEVLIKSPIFKLLSF